MIKRKQIKGAQPKQPKPRGGGKGKQPQQKPKILPIQVQDHQYNYDDTNNYYHNEHYRGQPRGHRPYRGQNTGKFFKGQNLHGRGQCNQNAYQGQYQNNGYQGKVYTITHVEISNRAIITTNLEAEATVVAEVITMVTVTAG